MNANAATPLVTIGMPVYNSERHLRQSLESLLAQTYDQFELVISDNASTDSTAAICEHYARLDSRIRYHRNPVNIGMTGNFNRVFELSRTKYIKWSTADDFWAPDMLADAVAVMEADPSVALCYPRTIIVDGDGKEQDRYVDQLHLMQEDPAERFLGVLANIKLVNHHLGLLRADAIRKTNLFGRQVSADISFVAEMALYGKFYEVKKFQFYRRFHTESSSWNRGDQEQEARRFHAANVRRIPFNTWLHYRTLLDAVRRAPLTLATKIKLFAHLSRMMYWDRRSLVDDLRRDVPAKLGMKPRNK